MAVSNMKKLKGGTPEDLKSQFEETIRDQEELSIDTEIFIG